MDEYLKVLTASPALMSSDFFVTVPNVLHAFCLTHDGASKVQEAHVFPAVSLVFGERREEGDYPYRTVHKRGGEERGIIIKGVLFFFCVSGDEFGREGGEEAEKVEGSSVCFVCFVLFYTL